MLHDLEDRSRRTWVPPSYLSRIHAALGEKDQAFELLESAFEEREEELTWLKVHFVYDPLRDDPRFDDLMRRVGFPED